MIQSPLLLDHHLFACVCQSLSEFLSYSSFRIFIFLLRINFLHLLLFTLW
jgi:hypothetical protein